MFGPHHCCSRHRVHLPRHWLELSLELSTFFNSQFESIRISPDGHSSFFFLFTETGICLKSSSSTKRIKGLFSTFAAILSQEVSRGLTCKAA